MEEYSDEVFEAIQTQIQEWGGKFINSRFFDNLPEEHQKWVEPVISAFTEMMYSHHGRRPTQWTVKSVEECCTQTIPRKVSIDADFFHAISPVLAAYFGYLYSVGKIRNGTALIRAIRRVEKKIIDNSKNPEHWGMAKSIISVASGSGVDLTDKDALQGFIDQLNSGNIEGVELSNLPVFGKQQEKRNKGSQGSSEDPRQTLLRFATKISKELAKDKPPSLTDEMKIFFERRPQAIFELLTLMVDHFEKHKEPDHWLVTAFLGFLGQQLEEIRYAVDRRFEWAIRLVEDFQDEVAGLAASDTLPFMAIKAIMDAILEAKLEHSIGLIQAHDEMLERRSPAVGMPTRSEFLTMLHGFVMEHKNDPFAISDGIADLVRYMPKEGQSFMIGEFVNIDQPGVKDAVALLTLNPESWIRKEALQWLKSNAKTITPTALRRLIVIRNWIPDNERKILDQVTKAARKNGVECAQWGAGETVDKIQSSQIDGAGAQGLMLVTKLGSKYRLSSVLVKQGVGIADAWSTPLIAKREVSATLRQAGESSVLVNVSARYFDMTVCHNIHVTLDAGLPPQVGLLQTAEMVGATAWFAQRIDFHSVLAEIIDAVTEKTIQQEDILKSSAVWGNLPGISDSWFEDGQEVVEFFRTTRIRKRDQLVQKVLIDFCESNRQSWAEKFAWMSLWYSEQPTKTGKKSHLAYNFAVLAREIYAGAPMKKLSLMEAIAQRTCAAFSKR